MICQYFISEDIALGQKSRADSNPYGQGFNYKVEVGFVGHQSFKHNQMVVRDALKKIDHVLLGVDSALIGDPTTANIARWIFNELRDRGATEVRLLRGDGLNTVITK